MAALPPRLREALDGYVQALGGRELAVSTRRVYQSRVTGYLAWLADNVGQPAAALRDPHARNRAVTGYQSWLRVEQGRAPAAINAVLTALDDFYRERGLGAAVTTRDAVEPTETPPLGERAVVAIEKAMGSEGMAADEATRERAVVDLMRLAGLAGAEVAALDVDDVRLSAGARGVAGEIRTGSRRSRSVPVHPTLAASLRAWLTSRRDWPGAQDSPALFVNRSGTRLSSRYCTMIVQQLGVRAGLELSPAILRATFAARLAQFGADPAAVAALTGRRVPEQQELPSAQSLAAAVGRL